MDTAYRPHSAGYDYYQAGIYHITLVTREREALFGCLNMDAHHPGVLLNEVGLAVLDRWQYIPAHHLERGRHLRLLAACCMPEHFHGVLEVQERMDVSVGEIIHGFKAGCTKAWRQLALANDSTGQQPRMATGEGSITSATCPATGENSAPNGALPVAQPSLVERLKHMSKKQRAAFYATRPRLEQPLFADNYDDTICMSHGQRQAMINYVNDNPRRAIIRRLRPDFMERRLHVVIDGQDYAAFGNLFLLRWANKEQVFCHRRVNGVPYETTPAYQQEHDQWVNHVMEGTTVLVTPGISEGEKRMKNECLERGYPLIHLQREPIRDRWKPEKLRFDACTRGTLLILSPWSLNELGEVNHVPSDTNYSQFHNLNTLAAQICAFDGEARIKGDK